MATPGRRTDASLEGSLFERGFNFEFFQAVRLLSRIYSGRLPVGGTASPRDEVVRFGAWLSLAFPASAVHDIQPGAGESHPVRMIETFFSLTGIQGILPLHYTEWMIARKAAKDDTLAAFLDLFNHRLVSLFYRAWEKHRPAVLYERAAIRGREPDAFTGYLYDLVGLGTAGLRGQLRIRDETVLRYAGLVAQRPVSASALRSILRDYFGVAVEIDQFAGCWHKLEAEDRCYLSMESERNQLGEAAFLGDEVWDQQARLRIRVGPMDLERYKEFLPDGEAMLELVDLTRFLLGQAIAFDVQLVLRAPEVPYCRLDDGGFDSPRLGWMGWLKTGEFTSDAGDALFGWVN